MRRESARRQHRRDHVEPETRDEGARGTDRDPSAEPRRSAAGPLSGPLRRARHQRRHVGSVLYDLDVPDFAKGPLSMSGIVLTSTSGVGTADRAARRATARRAAGAASRAARFSAERRRRAVRRGVRHDGDKPHKVDIVSRSPPTRDRCCSRPTKNARRAILAARAAATAIRRKFR